MGANALTLLRQAVSVTPSPSDISHATPPLLVGREYEQAVLHARLTAALGGEGCVVFISGEAGIGKTALAEAAAREASGHGAQVLIGRCYDLMDTPPYGLWIDLFTRHSRSSIPPPPDIFTQHGTAKTAASQAALFHQVLDFLIAAASHPLVLLLDDLHWADPASLDLLRYLGHYLTSLPLLLIVTYRTDELSNRRPLYELLPALARETNAERLDLRPFGALTVRRLVEMNYPLTRSETDRLSEYLHEHASGNPFFLGELLRALREQGVLACCAGGWSLGELGGVRVPAHVRQIIDARLARLGGGETQRLLAVAAVIGQEVPLTLLEAVGAIDEERLLTILERAITAHLLEEGPGGTRVRFVHALIREGLYQSILAPRRSRIHVQVGEWLIASPYPDPDAVAYHLWQAGDTRAVEWLVRAGERAQRTYAWLTAAERFETAMTLLNQQDGDAGARGWLCYRLALLRRFADPQGSISYLEEAARFAIEGDDDLLAACATFFRGHGYCNIGDLSAGLRAMEAGVAQLDALSAADQVRGQELAASGIVTDMQNHRGTFAYWLAQTGRFAEACVLAERVIARRRTLPATGGLGDSYATAYFGLGGAYAGLGRVMEAREAYAQARERYSEIEHHFMIGLSLEQEMNLIVLPYQADDRAERRRIAAAAEAALARASGAMQGQPPQTAGLLLLMLEGAWTDAHALASLRCTQGIDFDFIGRRVFALLSREQGKPDLAWAIVQELLPDGPRTEPGGIFFFTALALERLAATLSIDTGDLATARAWLEAHDRWLGWNSSALGVAEGDLGWATYHHANGDAASAYECGRRALEHAMQPQQPLALLTAHRLLGEMETAAGHLSEAATHLTTALALADICAAPYERALTLLAQAALYQATGDTSWAHVAIGEARAFCEPLGATIALQRADALAAMRGGRILVRSAAKSPGGLTRREREILRMIAEGTSNREIAAALFVSVRTIERHITNLYRKINARGKADATAHFFRHHSA